MYVTFLFLHLKNVGNIFLETPFRNVKRDKKIKNMKKFYIMVKRAKVKRTVTRNKSTNINNQTPVRNKCAFKCLRD